MTRSLLEASKARQSGTMTWDEYIHIILARAGGEKHENDAAEGRQLRWTDPFGGMTWSWIDRMGPIEDVGPLEAVFQAYRHGSLEDTKSKLTMLDGVPEEGARGVKQSLAMLACQERRADVLKFCLDEFRFPIELSFVYEAERVDANKDPKTFQAVWESEQFTAIKEAKGRSKGPQCPFDVGGKFPVHW